ncbi:MAG: glycosyltransferase family 4 protein [Opitutae bacterium]|jgi:glycosyltransferase involved in cell wall biosynthesis|nr:glycosyltransferase family 4 protein [Opitutae bacterium]
MTDLSDLKILMLAPCLGKYGGIESFCLTLCTDILKKGAIVCLMRKKVNGFCSDGSIEKNEDEISSNWSLELKEKFSSQYVAPRDSKIHQAIKDCDLVHLHNPVLEGVWWAKKEKKPCVMTVYNWRRKGFSPRTLAWEWAVRNADRRWYISEFVWNTWEKIRRKGSERLPVVSQMPQGKCDIFKRKGFLFIGRFVPNKGIRLLLDAYHRVSPDPDIWPLTLVGDGPLRDEVSQLISDKLIKGVKLTGFVSESERHRYTRNAKWMVTPPHTNEDLGLTPLEARSVGVPCIATNDGGIPETAGKHALFCKRGCVKSLAFRLKEAVKMCEAEYELKVLETKEGLQDYVRPLDEYAKNYLQLLHRN